MSLIAADENQGVRVSPPSHTSNEAATKATSAQPAASHVTLASIEDTEARKALSDHDGSVVDAAARKERWKEDNSEITAEHRAPKTLEEQLAFGTASPEGPPQRMTKANGASATPEVVVNRKGGAEPHITLKTSAEFAAENLRDRIKKQTSPAAEETDGDTDGGKRMSMF